MAAVCVLLRATSSQLMIVRNFHLSVSVNKLVQYNLSDIGEGIREVTIKKWFVKENDTVSQFDEICEVESDKAAASITSRYDGKITKLYHNIGDKAFVGQPLVEIDVKDTDSEEVSDESAVQDIQDAKVESGSSESVSPVGDESSVEDSYSERNWNKSLATPAVRRIAMENKIKISDVKGTGKHGRVMKEDILNYVENMKGSGTLSQKTRTSPLTQIQKVMCRTMTESLKIPQFVFSDELDVSKLVRLRAEAKEVAAKKSIKLSYLPFFIKAVSKGLSEYPILNSSFDEQNEQIVYKERHNIGIAVDSPSGLLVPNIKDVHNLSVVDVARELNRLQDLASKMKLSPADLKGGTISVSNIGTIGGTTATPVILPPEVCILAIGRIRRLPRYDSSGNLVPADILSISWSADHRILDGATVARCSEVFRYYVENPSALLLDL